MKRWLGIFSAFFVVHLLHDAALTVLARVTADGSWLVVLPVFLVVSAVLTLVVEGRSHFGSHGKEHADG